MAQICFKRAEDQFTLAKDLLQTIDLSRVTHRRSSGVTLNVGHVVGCQRGMRARIGMLQRLRLAKRRRRQETAGSTIVGQPNPSDNPQDCTVVFDGISEAFQ